MLRVFGKLLHHPGIHWQRVLSVQAAKALIPSKATVGIIGWTLILCLYSNCNFDFTAFTRKKPESSWKSWRLMNIFISEYIQVFYLNILIKYEIALWFGLVFSLFLCSSNSDSRSIAESSAQRYCLCLVSSAMFSPLSYRNKQSQTDGEGKWKSNKASHWTSQESSFHYSVVVIEDAFYFTKCK